MLPMLRLLLAFTAALSAASASAWEVLSHVDAITDAEVRRARVENAEGHTLTVFRQPSGDVEAIFRLSGRTPDQLSSRQLPIARVDKHQPIDITALRGKGLAAWEPKWVHFVIGRRESPDKASILRTMMDGQRIVVRYFLFTGGYRDTVFSLQGAREAIASAIGAATDGSLPLSADAQRRQREAEELCQRETGDALAACFQKVANCANWYESNQHAFRQCVAAPQ